VRARSFGSECVLVNVWTGESMPCLFNPTQLTEKLQVNWNRQVVPGLSHQVLQFQSTSNRQLTGVEFYLDRFFATEQPGDPNILEFRAFLRALTAPPAVTEGVLATAPPRVLVVWPNVVTIECVVASIDFQYRLLRNGSRTAHLRRRRLPVPCGKRRRVHASRLMARRLGAPAPAEPPACP